VGGPPCTTCHGTGIARPLDELHTGYDVNITDATGQRYSDSFTVAIDNITLNGDLLTIEFSASNVDIIPELLVSFYGWNSKNYLIPSHDRDANAAACPGFYGDGCQMEYVPESSGGGANPLFTEDAASVPGDWMVTLDMAAFQAVKTADIPTLIANGDVRMAEITLTPELTVDVGGTDVEVVLNAVGQTFDLTTSMLVNDYFKGANATVDTDKCNVCHDSLASSFHAQTGRGGGGIQVCKNCHNPTYDGSHIEMASRSIDNYVHAIHSFQAFDPGDDFGTFDPVLAKRYDQHIKHTFPNFTIRNCEACHLPGTYDVPDQSQSMPGVASDSDTVATWYEMVSTGGNIPSTIAQEVPAGRNIGTVPELVMGPGSRACGACHRADLINADDAGATRA
jgi:OmcA/MtrC family decaheme c-type cytochrome